MSKGHSLLSIDFRTPAALYWPQTQATPASKPEGTGQSGRRGQHHLHTGLRQSHMVNRTDN